MANLSNINNKFIVTDGNNGRVLIGATNDIGATLFANHPSTTAPSLTFNAPAGQVFENEDLQFAFGLNNASPFNGYMQTRFVSAPYYRNLAINPLGGNVGIGTNNPLAVLSIGSGSLTDANIPVQISTSGGTSQRWFGVNKDGNYGLLMGYLNGGSIGDAGAGAYIRNITEDPLYFMVSNSDLAMTIISNKNVGIGTDSPTSKLHLRDPGTNSDVGIKIGNDSRDWNLKVMGSVSDSLQFFTHDNNNVMTILPSGNVGIGTNSPGRELEVVGVIKADGTFISTASSSSTNLATANGGQLSLFNSNSTDGNFSNIGGYNSNSLVTSQICFINESHTSRTGAIAFLTHNGGSMPERMRITSGGDIQVQGGDIFLNSGTNYNDKGVVYLSNERTAIISDIVNLTANGDTSLDFQTRSGGIRASAMFIDEFRKVGIGTSGPPSKLTVMESTLCTNSGTDGGTSYVPAKPILLVTTDGNGTPSTNYATNSVFTVGIGGGITGGVTTKHLSVLLNGKVNIGTGTTVTGFLNIEKTGNHLHIRNSGAASGQYWNFDVASQNRLYILNHANTGVYINSGDTSWTGVSDETLKENVKPLENVLDKIKDYRCVEYNLKSVPNDKKIGFIAQDWVDDFAPIISKDDDGLLGMKYTETIPVLLKAIQELKADNDSLKARIETLENK